MKAPLIGDKVKYLGSKIVPDPILVPGENEEDESTFEDWKDPATGATGTVVVPTTPEGIEVPTIPGMWPVNVKWDLEESFVQTCFEGEVEKVGSN